MAAPMENVEIVENIPQKVKKKNRMAFHESWLNKHLTNCKSVDYKKTNMENQVFRLIVRVHHM